MATEELVEKYYGVVERHLRDVGLWEGTVRRFPPGSIRAAVKRILERMAERGYDPEMLDWGALFELLKDHPTVEAFIRYLERERYIPPSVREEEARVAEELEREVSDLLRKAKEVDPRILERLLPRIYALLGREAEIDRLRREVAELRTRASESREVAERYGRKVEELRRELERLRAENEALRRELERLKAVRPAPPPPPPPKPRPDDVERLRRAVEALGPDVEEAKRRIAWLRDVAEPLQRRYEGLASELTRVLEARDAERGEALARELEEFLKVVKGVLKDFEVARDEASRRVSALRRRISELASEAKRLGVELGEVGLDALAGEVEGVADALAKLPNLRMMVITTEGAHLPNLRRMIERLKAARPAPRLPGPPPPTPPEEAAKRPPPPAPKVLPPVPETCPIDGTPLERLSKVPLPGPGGVIELVDVPPTIAAYRCQRGHLFEVDPTGRLVERRPEHLAKEIVRELERARRVRVAAAVAPVGYPVARLRPPRPIEVVHADFLAWLARTKGMTQEEFINLSGEEKSKLVKEWLATRKRFWA